MAAGRGEFFRSLLQGLESRLDPPAPDRPGPRAGPAGPRRGRPGGRWRTRRPSQRGGNELSPEATTDKKKADIPDIPSVFPKENLLESLPSEILLKILSYLDPSSLFSISHVSKLFHQLANDNVMWYNIYMSEFGWKPKSVEGAAKEELAATEDYSTGHWKMMYFRSMAGRDMSKWRRELRDINPYTGLPQQTEWVLRNLKVSWELTLRSRWGREVTLEPSRVYFFESSVIVRWSGGRFLLYHHISNIQLHGVRKDAAKNPKARKPAWRSLILNLDMTSHLCQFTAKDRLVKLVHLSQGVIIGIWRGQSSVAFIMISLHFHRLVEKSLLGSPVCPYSEPLDLPPADSADPGFGLHGYTLHFVLHNTGTEIMSGHFHQLSCSTTQFEHGLVELRVIHRTNVSQHRSLSGSIKLPWKSEALEGSVENCCIMTLTLLDEFQKPFWCVSSPITITMAKRAQSFDYSGDHFLMLYHNPDGQVKMRLVWLKEERQFFLISLTLYVAVSKVNKHFSTGYGSWTGPRGL